MFSRLFPRHKARPDQAGFIRRGMAFGVDALIIAVLSLIVYTGFSELRARMKKEVSPLSRVVQVLNEGGSASVNLNEGIITRQGKKAEYLSLLKKRIPDEDYQKATGMTAEEIHKVYRKELAVARVEKASEKAGEKASQKEEEQRAYKVIKEYIISLLYFVLFFRFSGQTPGKKLFRLKVVDLEGKPQLNWYQCFERAHGYVCSGLFASLGFWQVLWNKQGLAMHDKIADTTVILSPKKKRPKKPKKVKADRNQK
jgi:hypothetical protein